MFYNRAIACQTTLMLFDFCFKWMNPLSYNPTHLVMSLYCTITLYDLCHCNDRSLFNF